MYSDLSFCIKAIAKGDLYKFDTKKLQKKSLKSATTLEFNNDKIGMMWAQQFETSAREEAISSSTQPRAQVLGAHNARRRMSLQAADFTKDMQLFNSLDVTAVEKILNYNEKTKQEMNNIEFYFFDIFAIREYTNQNELVTVTCHILAKEKLFDKLPIVNEKFLPFIHKVQNGYKDITYHNKTHGADLAQTFYHMCTIGDLKQVVGMDDIDMFSYIVAGACHDIGHPGMGNIFLIETKDTIALRYNDVSVLENFHIASTFDILMQEKYDILANFDKSVYKRIRKSIIGAIIATDMAHHFSKFSIFKGKVMSAEDNDFKKDDEKEFICQQIFHLCDISNATKPWDICEKWTNYLFAEFFH